MHKQHETERPRNTHGAAPTKIRYSSRDGVVQRKWRLTKGVALRVLMSMHKQHVRSRDAQHEHLQKQNDELERELNRLKNHISGHLNISKN